MVNIFHEVQRIMEISVLLLSYNDIITNYILMLRIELPAPPERGN